MERLYIAGCAMRSEKESRMTWAGSRTVCSTHASLVVASIWLACWGGSAEAQAPQTIIVPLSRAVLTWDNPTPTDGVSYAERYVLTCTSSGLVQPVEGSVSHPINTMPLVDVLPGTGIYDCTVRAENSAGVSPESNTLHFGAGGPPDSVSNVRIEVR